MIYRRGRRDTEIYTGHRGLPAWDTDTLLTSEVDGEVPSQREHYHLYHCTNHICAWVTI